jgi:tRNA (guanine37-N1)-methyltransferase
MKFSFVTAFPNLIKPYFKDSILKRAIKNNLIEILFYDIRKFSNIDCNKARMNIKKKYTKIDSPLCGGGAGLVFSPKPLFDCLDYIKNKYHQNPQNRQPHIIFLTPQAPLFTQNDALRLAKNKNHIVFVSSRYQGVDERVIEKYGDEVFSIGEYVLTGGELPSLVLCDSIARNIKGVLGNEESLDGESYGNSHLLAPPDFCKPLKIDDLQVPNILISGNHKKIDEYKTKLSQAKTKYYYPNLF